jgi:hypothetical protein
MIEERKTSRSRTSADKGRLEGYRITKDDPSIILAQSVCCISNCLRACLGQLQISSGEVKERGRSSLLVQCSGPPRHHSIFGFVPSLHQ